MVSRYSNTYLYMFWSDFYGYKRLKSRSVQEIRGNKETDKEVGEFMTREEIIDGLQYTIDMFCFNPSTGEVTDKNRLNDESRLTVDACEGAIEIIKALEQQPCGNAIDRKLVCAFIDGLISDDGEREKGLEYIRNMPPVNPTKTGHWIKLGVQGEIDDQIVKGFVCSKCGAISVFRMTGRKIINGDLCPSCGAKMLEGVRT